MYRQILRNYSLDAKGHPIDLDEEDQYKIYNLTIIDIANRLLKYNKGIANLPEFSQPDPSTYNAYTARA